MIWDKKTVAAIAACFLFYLGYTQYLSHKYPNYGRRTTATQNTSEPTNQASTQNPTPQASSNQVTSASAPTGDATTGTLTPAVTEIKTLSDQELTLSNDAVTYQFDQERSALKSVKLKKYRPNRTSAAGEAVELLDSSLLLQATDNISLLTGQQGYSAERNGSTLSFMKKDGDWLIRQDFAIPEKGYALNVKVSFQNLAEQPKELTGGLLFQESIVLPESKGMLSSGPNLDHRSLIHVLDKGITTLDGRKHCEKDTELALSARNTPVAFIGIDSLYFMKTMRPINANVNVDMGKIAAPANGKCPIAMTAYQSFGQVKPQETVSMSFEGYFGPKDLDILVAHQADYKKAVDFGIFKILAYPLLVVLKWMYKVTHNYGIAIILLTLVLKVAFYPLTRSAAVSMKQMQKFQPEMNRIRERFKDDPQNQQRELMKFMGTHKINPAKGCLPILPQIPVFIAFYNVLSHAIELRHAPFAGWLMDLSSADPLYISPVLWGVFMLIQQKLTPNPSMDKHQQKVLMFMPILFTAMMISLPAGMLLYMLTNTIISIGQQQWLNKRLDQPAGKVSMVEA